MGKWIPLICFKEFQGPGLDCMILYVKVSGWCWPNMLARVRCQFWKTLKAMKAEKSHVFLLWRCRKPCVIAAKGVDRLFVKCVVKLKVILCENQLPIPTTNLPEFAWKDYFGDSFCIARVAIESAQLSPTSCQVVWQMWSPQKSISHAVRLVLNKLPALFAFSCFPHCSPHV